MKNRNTFQAGSPIPFCPEYGSLKNAFHDFILSPSGFRKVFSSDGIEESASPSITEEDATLTLLIARELAIFLKKKIQKENLTIAVGTDTRPTGPTLAELLMRVFLSEGFQVRYLGVSAAPEIMAYTKTTKAIDAFAYVSASHNPIGHNGFKFGLSDGAVLDPDVANDLIQQLKDSFVAHEEIHAALSKASFTSKEALSAVYTKQILYKEEALKSYYRFSTEVLTGTNDSNLQKTKIDYLKEKISLMNLGIAIDFNGSARTTSIDVNFLNDLGVTIRTINDKPGAITHRIVPEGSSLEYCRTLLEKAAREGKYSAEKKQFLFGYMPDNDGDRGNLVYIQDDGISATVLEAQQLFALCVLSELASLALSGETKPLAVAVNCCTSRRVDDIAKAFGAKVFRAEVGEANVVNLARQLRQEGYVVRILGEGSNGGNITDPATVRDPLNTLGALIKLLTQPELFQLWCEKTQQSFNPQYTTETILASLPAYTTTGAYEPQAKVEIKTTDHAALKAAYEKLFPDFWENDLVNLRQDLDIVSWKEFNYEKTQEKEGVGPEFRSGTQRGGFKIQFYNHANEAVAFIWMRGSGTEPVFRVLAEVKGINPSAEAELLRLHTQLILQADSQC